jgi:two-component system chemotaxis response regulator CheY
MRVLIADDQKSVGTTLAHLVSECNHEVVEVVGSGLEAIQAYNRHKPDVVLMDYWMSKLNGATACRNILAKDPSARVILVSGWSHLDDLEQSGAVRILSKPVEIGVLEYALNEAAGRTGEPVAHTVEPIDQAENALLAEISEEPSALPEFSGLSSFFAADF